jgi:hypothetical protein
MERAKLSVRALSGTALLGGLQKGSVYRDAIAGQITELPGAPRRQGRVRSQGCLTVCHGENLFARQPH